MKMSNKGELYVFNHLFHHQSACRDLLYSKAKDSKHHRVDDDISFSYVFR